MTWFFVALVGPFFYAICNHIDKILLEKYFKTSGVGTLLLFSSLLSSLALPFLYMADPLALSVGLKSILILSCVGIINILFIFFYLIALNESETSVTIIFYQLVPVFGLILGYFILGETVTRLALFAMTLIILGTTIISFEIDNENNFKLRKKTIVYMLAATFCWALGSVVFKAVALEENVWRSLFWEHVMLTLIGILIFIFGTRYRAHFLDAIKSNSKAIISLNITNELIYMSGNIVFAYAYLLAPIALVLLIDSFQPFFVLIIGIFLTVFFPKLYSEEIDSKHLTQKIVAIVLTFIGTYLLFIS